MGRSRRTLNDDPHDLESGPQEHQESAHGPEPPLLGQGLQKMRIMTEVGPRKLLDSLLAYNNGGEHDDHSAGHGDHEADNGKEHRGRGVSGRSYGSSIVPLCR